MSAYLHFRTCFKPLMTVYLPKAKHGPDAFHQAADDLQVYQEYSGTVWPIKDRSALSAARREMASRVRREANA